ncbi:MAG: HAMP domain-containing histidine kinase [Anaerolineae bacterium]|nr:HAMP domain-containing histidine kinase [Phycisphaerae bacterium]
MSQTDPEVIAAPRPWERKSWIERITPTLGLQGKLLLCFMALLTVALGASCIIFMSQTAQRLDDILGQQTQQLATALAFTCADSMELGDAGRSELMLAAGDVIKGRNIVLVAFYDTEGKLVAARGRDPDFEVRPMPRQSLAAQLLMQVQHRESRVFGKYVEVVAPVLTSPTKDRLADGVATSPGVRILGYVSIGLASQYEASQMARINMMVIGAGCIVAFISLPMAYLLVKRIFSPIHQLLAATKKIIAGDLDMHVAAHRRDVIGDLASSFNEMAVWVKQQQQDVALANLQLAEANRDLEQKVEQRTSQFEIANKRLSQEIAEKEEFLRAVSHDLNAPLRNISGMATILLMKHKEQFDEDVIHRLERIKSNVDVETDLISELLELSRIKTRRQKLEIVDTAQIVWELRGLFENDLRSRGIDLVVDSQLPMLNAERARVRQVFQNLIDNAIKYMGDKSPREIHVGCQLRANEAEFYVRDTGLGIDPEDVEKVFFVFRRGKSTATQNIAGKGVGLASVKSIVETYNGRIWVESKLAEGTTFRFTINGMFVGGEANPMASAAAAQFAQDGDDDDEASAEPNGVPQPTAA